ncbi:MAG: o-succinylbenzoate synthase, partial [bacterium]
TIHKAGLDLIITSTIDSVVARTACVHLAAVLDELPPCGLNTAHMLETDLCEDPAPADHGFITVPQMAGNGTDRAWPDEWPEE